MSKGEYRPVNKKQYDENFDAIKWISPKRKTLEEIGKKLVAIGRTYANFLKGEE